MIITETFEELLFECSKNKLCVYEQAQAEEAFVQDFTVEHLRNIVYANISAMKECIKNGVKTGELSKSGLSGGDCKKLQSYFKNNPALFGKFFEKITIYAFASAEENARMGKIVACPTAGSCGIVPAVLITMSEEENISKDNLVNGLITAGKIGQVISNKVRLAGAAAGCQAECGVAAGMSAGLLTYLRGGSNEKIVNAAILAIKNILGLTCDPVCGLVEVPCVKRNPFLAIHAVTASEMALAGIESKIPPDEVVDVLARTGSLMSPVLKETSLGGLAKTKTAIEFEKQLADRL